MLSATGNPTAVISSAVQKYSDVPGDKIQPGVVYTTFHFPLTGANIVTTDNSDWATNCPEYKVTAVQLTRVTQPSEWQKQQQEFNCQQLAFLDKARRSEA